ncbi:hypothetical protein PAXRUDRAFT_835167 [Paxillus rubicundulus Ve08.2h10]|uniref:Uncharacterized protein n=1 Tax=Paxillus rubicundulus Ve08.2h10 TaxID=930991 RepID=A0A0D0C157_9AGAM|nr:hypothetical protein PAXRUDRAFT_835167 [Paxillus rubicundulus Ve08.2h10]
MVPLAECFSQKQECPGARVLTRTSRYYAVWYTGYYASVRLAYAGQAVISMTWPQCDHRNGWLYRCSFTSKVLLMQPPKRSSLAISLQSGFSYISTSQNGALPHHNEAQRGSLLYDVLV